MFRKSVAVFCVSIVLCQVGGMWAVLTSALWVHKQAKELRMADPKLWVHLSLTTSEFSHCLLVEDELEIDGILYDIVSTSREGECVEVVAVADNAEQKLKHTIGGLHQHENQLQSLAKIACAFGLTVCEPEESVEATTVSFPTGQSICIHPKNSIRKGVLRNLEQPPNAS